MATHSTPPRPAAPARIASAAQAALSKTFQNVSEPEQTRFTESSKTLPNQTGPSVSFREGEICGTNPKVPSLTPALTPRQLAAARWLVRGVRVGDVAGKIGVSRQTIAAWKRSPLFVQEIQRLHELLLIGNAGRR